MSNNLRIVSLAGLAKKKRQQAMTEVWFKLIVIAIVPQIIFTYRLFTEISAQAAKRIIKRFYLAELFKFILIGFLFIVILKWVPVTVEAFIAGIVLVQLTLIFAPFIVFIRQREKAE